MLLVTGPMLLCPQCDVGKTVTEDFVGLVRFNSQIREFFCVECDCRWQFFFVK